MNTPLKSDTDRKGLALFSKLKAMAGAMAAMIAPTMAYGQIQQSLSYEILRHEKPIGKLIATRETLKEHTNYTLRSSTQVTILLSFHIQTLLQETNIAGKLTNYTSTQHVNNHLRENKYGMLHGGVHESGNGSSLKKENIGPVFQTVAGLYFHEPIGQDKVFSESEQRFLSLRPLGNHRYVLGLSNEVTTTYSYRNDQCISVYAETMWSDLEFRLLRSDIAER